jgi:N-terminal domain of toast_rack, DUF2154
MIFRSLPALAALSLTGCVVDGFGPGDSNPPRHEFRTLERDSIQHLRVNLKMGAGDLQASSGTEKLLAADFTYAIPFWKPEVRYHANGSQGDLTISQPGDEHGDFRGHVGNHKYLWDIRLSRDIPTDLFVRFGAGNAQLDLGGLNLDNVDVEMGVGDLKMDLRGVPRHDYHVRVRGGVGQATVRLAADTGVVADVEGGIGSIDAPGLIRHGNLFENEAYGKSRTIIHMDIRGAIGSIHLLSD